MDHRLWTMDSSLTSQPLSFFLFYLVLLFSPLSFCFFRLSGPGLRIFGGSISVCYDDSHGMGGWFLDTLLPVHSCMERFPDHNAFNPRLIDQLCAFNLYTRHGFDTACSVYPEQREFILAHKHQTLEEVRKECYKDLEKNSDRS